MDHFEYEPIDLERRSCRLVRLCKGDDGPIQCELFHTWLDDANDAIEYEALSYTWGGIDKPYRIMINGRKMPVTRNLYLALEHLRCQHQDRILWIDAICIDQDNHEERGHQVRHMASIYTRAEQVIMWLGQATPETDLLFFYIQQLEIQTLNHACNAWRASDERWQFLWSTVELSLRKVHGDPMDRLREGLRTLLDRSWFKRVWILQEVANARSAKVMCGTKSVSARIFAIVPLLVEMTPNFHCQAVLDIMPGPSRKYSWWTENRDLRTLLVKFRKSEASDERDIIYALLGISSDACDTDVLMPNYGKSLGEVIHDTIAFLLHVRSGEDSMPCLPQWTLSEFMENLESLNNKVFIWAANGRHETIAKLLLNTGKVDVDVKDMSGMTLLTWAIVQGCEAIVKLLLDTAKVDVNSIDLYGRTPLTWAVVRGCEATVKLLLDTDKVDINLADQDRDAMDAMEPMLSTANANPKRQDIQTPLLWAVKGGHEAIVKLLLNTNKVNVNSKDMVGRTPLSYAAEDGHVAIAKLLLNIQKNVNVNSKDMFGETPLSLAVQNGHEAIINLLHDHVNHC